MKFSERIGKKDVKSVVQIDTIDEDLRISLWNLIFTVFFKTHPSGYNLYQHQSKDLLISVWRNLWKKAEDEIPVNTLNLRDYWKNIILNSNYLDIYDLLEYIAQVPFEQGINISKYILACNRILERELSAYRFIHHELVPINNQTELDAINTAISSTSVSALNTVRTHLDAAVSLLSDRENPDYRNSIKESISALESICKIINSDNSSEFPKAIKAIKSKIGLHEALVQGFTKIYGYTSDGDGIRHALTEEPNVNQEDAIFMLVSCSSFINYIIVKANKAGLLN